MQGFFKDKTNFINIHNHDRIIINFTQCQLPKPADQETQSSRMDQKTGPGPGGGTGGKVPALPALA